MMRFFSRMIFIISLSISFWQAHAQSSNTAELLKLVNEVRIAQGLAPLVTSDLLTTVAQAHSDDMASTGDLSHSGSNGSEFWQRMQAGGYSLTTGAENILERRDTNATGAFEQWEGSPPHLANMLSPSYHEIGIAYAQGEDGTYYYTMVLGARADSTPQPYASPTMTATPTKKPTQTPTPSATFTPTLTLTPFPTASSLNQGVILPTASPTLRVVTNQGPPQIRLTYNDSTIILQNIASEPININSMIFAGPEGVLPSSRWNEVGATALKALQPGDCLQIWTLNTTFLDTPEDCRIRQAWLATGAAGQFWRGEGVFTVQKNDRIVAECPIAAGLCEFALVRGTAAQDPVLMLTEVYTNTDVRLIVNPDGITIMNVSGRDINLSSMRLVSETGSFVAETWNDTQIERPFDRFPTQVCMQIWAFKGDADQEPPNPEECVYRFAWLLVPLEEQFWRGESFRVMNQGIEVEICATSERICNIVLPEEHK